MLFGQNFHGGTKFIADGILSSAHSQRCDIITWLANS